MNSKQMQNFMKNKTNANFIYSKSTQFNQRRINQNLMLSKLA